MIFKDPLKACYESMRPGPLACSGQGRARQSRADQARRQEGEGKALLAAAPPVLLSDRRGRRARFGAEAARTAPAGSGPSVLAPPVRHCGAPAGYGGPARGGGATAAPPSRESKPLLAARELTCILSTAAGPSAGGASPSDLSALAPPSP